MNIAAEIGLILIEFQIEKMQKAAAGDTRQDEPAAATNETDLEPAHNHYARRANDKQAEA